MGTCKVLYIYDPRVGVPTGDIIDPDDPAPVFIQAHSTTTAKEQNFIDGEQLGTLVNPRCGSCKCGKCPQPGATYSFSEEKELKMIQENLRYDPEKRCWFTSYPWLRDPAGLTNNYPAALCQVYDILYISFQD